jgi:Tfp pilus assembly protein PilF
LKALAIRIAAGAIAVVASTSCTGGDGTRPGTSGVAGSAATDAASQVATMLSQGIANGQRGDFTAAKSSFEMALKIDGTNKFAWYNLGVLAQQRHQLAEAAKDYDRALSSDPRYTPAMYNKAILVEAKNQDLAIALYQQILTVDAKASTTYVRLGLLQLRKGDEAAARTNFATAVKLDPRLGNEIPADYRPQ